MITYKDIGVVAVSNLKWWDEPLKRSKMRYKSMDFNELHVEGENAPRARLREWIRETNEKIFIVSDRKIPHVEQQQFVCHLVRSLGCFVVSSDRLFLVVQR